ncbi:M56 family metallopeptidase [Spirillospora sp. CA-253888]
MTGDGSVLVAAVLVVLALALLVPAPRLLARAAWPHRAPRAALALWHAVAHTAGLSVVGAFVALAVSPLAVAYRHGLHVLLAQTLDGDPLRGLGPFQIAALAGAATVAAGLTGLLVRTAVANARFHRSHRDRVDLVGDRDARPHGLGEGALEGVRVLDHPAPFAYCLPGLRARVVISSGLVALLDPAELAAVVEHERAHARGRHHLLLLPFAAVARALPRAATARLAADAARRLTEMLADDQARSRHGGATVATALVRLATHRAESGAARPLSGGALAAAEHAVLARVQRLLAPATAPAWQRLLAYTAAAALVAVPTALLVPCLT